MLSSLLQCVEPRWREAHTCHVPLTLYNESLTPLMVPLHIIEYIIDIILQICQLQRFMSCWHNEGRMKLLLKQRLCYPQELPGGLGNPCVHYALLSTPDFRWKTAATLTFQLCTAHPARMMTEVVPSPTSSSWARLSLSLEQNIWAFWVSKHGGVKHRK